MRCTLLATVAFVGLAPAGSEAQSPPAGSRPPVLFIAREVEKVGHSAAHLRLETEWTAALSRAGQTAASLGIVSETGVAEAWWLHPHASFEAMGQSAGSGVQAIMEKYSALDAAHVDSWRGLTAVLRPDLSYGEPANLVTLRGMEITNWRIRPGHDLRFVEATKTYTGAARRVGSNASWATYEVVAGAPAGTFLTFFAKRSMADYDADMRESQKIFGGFTAEEGASLNKFLAESVMSMESNRFRVDPNISIVADDMIKAAPDFWTPSWKKPARKVAKAP